MKTTDVKNLLMKSLLIAGLFLVQSCGTVPLTGRSQLNLLPESSMVEMGLTSYGTFLSENKLSTNQTQTDMVKRVGKNIALAVEQYLRDNGFESYIANFQWEFNLIEDDVPNAWCMPGGKVVFYTGILPYTQNEAGIAVVMGHEVAHAVARHGNERMSQQMVLQMGGVALSEAVKTKPEETQAIFSTAYGLGSSVGVMLPFSRKHEYEADKMGLIFMAMAGYDPRSAVAFWKRMSESGGAKTPELLSTHPVDVNRIAALEKIMPEALKYYQSR
ncbi:M48 family metallopeptidase [Gaoshiqia sp. Z1-71]|uniref:M48 family metallopeptidase n=1 Tax=Gaoshiqia hydrogeniformans TaxID=3290090 RepID=UPI003BF89A90